MFYKGMSKDIKSVRFHTLGCKLNFSESSTLAREFEEAGFARAQKGDIAAIEVVNTCSVTDQSDKKCRNIIRRIIKNNPEAIVAVTGCYAQLKATEISAIEGVDIVLGNSDKGSLVDAVRSMAGSGKSATTCEVSELTGFFAAFSSGDRTRSFLKVQDGCDYKCSYCTIPLARGASRNISIAEIVAEAQKIAASGAREIVLTGVNIGDFGRTTGENFIELITALDKIEGIERYRISSIEPNLLTDQVLDFTTNSAKFQPHYHIPLQSGSDAILALMRRRYNTTTFAERIQKVRAKDGDTFIGIDVIVGFPGESEQEFETTYKLLEQIAPSYLHIFPYSERANTPAIEFDGKVSKPQKDERVRRLSELSAKLHHDFSERFIGSVRPMLVEGTKKGGIMFGHTDNYLRVELPYQKGVVGKIVDVRITGFGEGADMVGELV